MRTLWEAETPATCEGQAHSAGPAETQNRGGSLRDLPAAGGVSGSENWMELSPQKKRQVDDTSPALLWSNRAGTLGSPKHSIPLAGDSDLRCFSANHQHVHPLGQAESDIAAQQAERGFPSFLYPVTAKLEKSLQDPALTALSSVRAAQPITLLPSAPQPCDHPTTL